MYMVEFRKVWKITSSEDYKEAMKLLDEAEFVAEMADDYYVTIKEKEEIARQRKQISKMAIKKQ